MNAQQAHFGEPRKRADISNAIEYYVRVAPVIHSEIMLKLLRIQAMYMQSSKLGESRQWANIEDWVFTNDKLFEIGQFTYRAKVAEPICMQV